MKKIQVKLAERSHFILVGDGAMGSLSRWKKGTRAFVVADSRLNQQRGKLVSALKRGGWEVHWLSMTATESLKDLGRVQTLYTWLVKNRADRKSVLFALGGGVIGDAVGFVAGTYLRGIAWVGVPTTLLAQVDSSVGGKTGVNHPFGKNLIGVFHQPSLVVADIGVLKTLPHRDLVSGMGEIIKYALIQDAKFFSYLEKNRLAILKLDPKAVSYAVAHCASLKAKAVSQDERDVKGVRERLNFGHTIGHALEAATNYGYFRHGEAVIWGMRVSVLLSWMKGSLETSDFARIDDFLAGLAVPPIPSRVGFKQLEAPLKLDKKARDGKLRLVLLKKLGKAYSAENVKLSELKKAFEALKEAYS